jgi:serine/threonine protein kinase
MRQLTQALAYLLSQGVVHRDLKPDNIMVATGPMVTIIDFNVAYDLNKESPDGRVRGSTGLKEWSAPETRS